MITFSLKSLLNLVVFLWFLCGSQDNFSAQTTKRVNESGSNGINIRTTVAGEKKEGGVSRLFILSGQSNMALLDERYSFIPALQQAFPNDEIVVVKNSKGGQQICEWILVEPEKEPVPRNLYTLLLSDVKSAMKGKEFASACFVWYQGGADAKRKTQNTYEVHLKGLIKQLRTDMSQPNMPVLIIRMNTHLLGDEGWDTVRTIQVKVAEEDPLGDWLDTDPLGSNLHYHEEEYGRLGVMLAEKAAALTKKQSKKAASGN